jgi:hypothetical protein
MGLNTKEQDIIDLLTITNGKLDDILTALGAIGSFPAPTTNDLDDIHALLEDIHTDTTSIEASNSELETRLDAMFTFIATEFPLVVSHTNDTRNYLFYALINLGLVVTDSDPTVTNWLFDTKNLFGLISGAIGVPIDGGNRNVIELLAEMNDRPLGVPAGGLVPQSVCDDAYITTEMVLVPAMFPSWGPTIWAKFPDPPPDGMEFGTVFGFGEDRTELTITGDNWADWKLYVATEGSNFGIFIGSDLDLSTARYPTNVWIDLGFLTTSLAVFVNAEHGIKAYLCAGDPSAGGGGGGPWGGGGGGGGPWGDPDEIPALCGEFASEAISSQIVGGSPDTRATIDLGAVYNAGADASANLNGTDYTSDHDMFAHTNGNGWTIKVISNPSGLPIRISTTGVTNNYGATTIASVDETYTIDRDTNCWFIDRAYDVADPDAVFTVEICRPE